MEVHPSTFGVLCTVFLVMGCLLEGSCSLRVPGIRGNMHTNFMENIIKRSSSSLSVDSYEAYNYTQVLDHFSYTPQSYQTFPHRYFIDNSSWGGAQNNSPIFVWLGEETDVENDLNVGILTDQAPNFKALVVYIEHRYYGTSMPFGGLETAYANASTMGYFTSTQALADYASVIIYLKKKLKAENCPVIVFGGSYGGMLAAWFRLKYPHITIGALASSAPLLYFDDLTPTYGYYSVVTNDFRNVSEICYKRINESWDMMDKIASTPQGLLNLSKIFNTCENLSSTDDLYDLISRIYFRAAQYNFTKVEEICNAINSPPEGTDTVTRIATATKYILGSRCFNASPFNSTYDGWDWQICTEMVLPTGNPPGVTMFPPDPYDVKSYARECYLKYGVLPRRHWATTEFGGHNIEKVLKDFGSNIIFSNGLRDPWSSGGVVQNISESIVAITTEEGTHCEDIGRPSAVDDPEWLKEQRLKEIMIIGKWIDDYKKKNYF